jgi:sugar transferase (PEP-CTERM/EpsH1 system associated)
MSAKPGLLFVSHRLLFPPDKGERIRGWALLRHLSASYDIHLGCLDDEPAAPAALAALGSVCAEVAAFAMNKRRQKLHALLRLRPGRPLMPDYYHHAGLQRWVDGVLARQRMEILYIYSAAMAPYVLGHDRPGRILDMQDIDSEKWTSYAARAAWPMRLVWAREGRTLLAFERAAARACDATLLVTEKEARRFMQLAPESAQKIGWLEHGVDTGFFAPGQDFADPYAGLPGAGPDLVFTGNMDYWPNADAVLWFAHEVMPQLRRHRPEVRLHVVGANPGPDITGLARLPGIHVTGRVPDVRPYVAHAALAVAPLRIARGIQNKVLEAMAMGRPVVASPGAFEGIRAEPGRDLLVADGAAETVRCVLEILDGRHPGLGAAGRALIEARYSWRSGLARLDRILAATREARP